MKKTVLILLTFFAFIATFAQQSLNDYKYIIVPEKFEFLKEADQYRLNSLTKYLFEKYNFEPIMADDVVLPSDYAKNNCLALKADVLKESNFFKTKLLVQLKNCKNEVIFTSIQGESRDKNLKVAYNEALRQAFTSFESENYNYNAKNEMTLNQEIAVVEEKQEEIDKLKAEVKQLKEATKDESVVVEEIKEQQIKKEESSKNTADSNYRLRAEAIPDSAFAYNLINSNGNKVFSILFSGKTDLYIVKDRDAIIYKLNNNWVIAEANGNDLKVTALEIKF